MISLDDWAAPISESLPQTLEDEPVLLTPSTVRELPTEVETRALAIRRSRHGYGGAGFEVDFPQWYAPTSCYASLGLAMLSALFGDERCYTIHLRNPQSEIRELRLRSNLFRIPWESVGLSLRAESFHYQVRRVNKHPWLTEPPASPYAYPGFQLTNAEDSAVTDEQRSKRDVLVCYGTPEGWSRFVQLFLDMSRAANETREVVLEIEGGFRGVCPLSCESRFWLPGGWDWQPSWFE